MGEQVLPAVVTNYLTVALMPAAAAQGKPFGARNEREMRTLAESIDAILSGQLAQAGDILMQRFRACEMSALESSWRLASHLELIPQQQVSCVPPGMRQEIVKEDNAAAKLEDRMRRKKSG